MTTREFDYTADEFDAEQPVRMATLRWSTMDGNSCYHHHSLRMEHHDEWGFTNAKNAALAIMGGDYPNAAFTVRDSYRKGTFYSAFLIDAVEQTERQSARVR